MTVSVIHYTDLSLREVSVCSACGSCVPGELEATHSDFHRDVAAAARQIAELVRHVGELEEELREVGSRVVRLDRGARLMTELEASPAPASAPASAPSTVPAAWPTRDASVSPGHVRIVVDGPRDDVSAAASLLRYLAPSIRPYGPIMRDASVPVHQTSTFVVPVEDLALQARDVDAARLCASGGPGRVPAPIAMNTDMAAQVARHARAAVSHLASIDALITSGGAYGDEELAAFMRSALDLAEGADTWAQGTAHKSGVTQEMATAVNPWCHLPGGKDATPTGQTVT